MAKYYIATGTATYPATSNVSQLPSVEEDVRELRTSLEVLGYRNALPVLPTNPSREQLLDLGEWFRLSDRHPDDEVILYYTGHGSVDDVHYLLLASGKRFSTVEFFREIAREPIVRSVLIVLDTCQSGALGIDIGQVFADFEERLEKAQAHITVLTSCRSRQEAKESTFTPAFCRALRNQADPTQQFLHFQDVTKAVRDLLPKWQRMQVFIKPETETGECPFRFPNPQYDSNIPNDLDLETQRRIIERKTHWDPRNLYFTGRSRAIGEIGKWLGQSTSDGKVRVVTGSPGAGKSALLSYFATHKDSVLIPIHARGKDLDQITEILARAARISIPSISVVADSRTRAETIATEIANGQKNTYLCVDALDEAVRPWEVASHLLKPLVGSHRVWLLVGTRPDTSSAGSNQRFRGFGTSTEEIDLDRGEYFDASDLFHYVKHRLLEQRKTGVEPSYAGTPHLVEEATRAVSKAAGRNFLVAKLTCDSLLQDPPPLAEARQRLSELPSDLTAAFDEYLRRFDLRVNPDWSKQKLVDLLQPLAYAQGQGVPRPQWALFARTLSGRLNYVDADVRAVMEEAAPYIVASQEAGRTVYRLFHESFAEYLRAKADFKDANRGIAKALVDEVERDEMGQRNWSQMDWFTRRYLSVYAAASEVLDELVEDLGYLTEAEPGPLRSVILHCVRPRAAQLAQIYSIAAHQLGSNSKERSSYLGLAAWKLKNRDLAKELLRFARTSPWSCEACVWQNTTPHQVLEGHERGVSAVALGQRQGRPVIVSGSFDWTVRVWDMETLEALGSALEGHQNEVSAVALGQRQGRPVIVSGSRDRTVRVWDMETLEALGGALEGHQDEVTAVALGQRQGRPVIVSGSRDRTVRVWDMETLEAFGGALKGHHREVSAVAVGQRQGRAVIVSGSWDKTLRVWDMETLEALGGALEGHKQHVTALAVGQRQGRAVIVSGSFDRTVRVWDMETLEALGGGALEGHHSDVSALAVGHHQGRAVIVSGSWDKTLRVWDMETLRALGDALEGHQSYVTAVAIGQHHGRAVIVSGSRDSAVRVWDMNTLEVLGSLLEGHHSDVSAVAIGQHHGRAVIVSVGRDRTVRVWDMETLEALGASALESHSYHVTALAVGQRQGRTVIVSGSLDTTIRVWDMETLKALGASALEGHQDEVTAVAIGRRRGRAVIVSGSQDRTVRVWDMETPKAQGSALEGHERGVSAVVIGQRQGRAVIVSGSDDRTVRVWDMETLKAQGGALEGHERGVSAVVIGQRQGRAVIVSGSYDGTVRVWDMETLRALGSALEGHESGVSAVAVGERQGRAVIVIGNYDRAVRMWDMETSTLLLSIDVGSTIGLLRIDGENVVVGCQNGIIRIRIR
jgi:WD40 repeat protein